MLDMQGFSALWQIRLVSLWVFSSVFSLLWTPIFVYLTFTLKLFLGEKFQRDRNSFIVSRKFSEWAKALRRPNKGAVEPFGKAVSRNLRNHQGLWHFLELMEQINDFTQGCLMGDRAVAIAALG